MSTDASTTTTPIPLFITPMDVRWQDLDAFNHVNNANYLVYLQEARLKWMMQLPDSWYSPDAAPVMAHSEINYRLPIEWPADVQVELYVNRMGTSSMTVGHRIVDSTDATRVHADGSVTMVWIDTRSGRPVALPQAIRDAVARA
ncbi:thioesterase family protein [Luteibacter sp. PPL201]|jgi:acyl-CoA thioester hydrolase|uniref:Thioesterase family protein n=1 Tax=Luteibacter sahnii TaxID=3021977 RepID=A0ABT6BAT5_9GAMM|nr:thioesterase family protein [Luteibacter sp. PPL193]MDY1547222.1 thioesterase family protein [Luteibacter sp. PPL193]